MNPPILYNNVWFPEGDDLLVGEPSQERNDMQPEQEPRRGVSQSRSIGCRLVFLVSIHVLVWIDLWYDCCDDTALTIGRGNNCMGLFLRAVIGLIPPSLLSCLGTTAVSIRLGRSKIKVWQILG